MKYLAFSSLPAADMLKALNFMVDISRRSGLGRFTYEDLASALDKWFFLEKIPLKTHTFLSLLFDGMDRPNSIALKIKPDDLVAVLGLFPDRLKANIPDEFIEKHIPQKLWTKLRPSSWVSSHN
jgi:hypothetical protein